MLHGARNELHTPENVRAFAETNDVQVHLLDAKHNDLMHVGHPALEEMVGRIVAFACAVTSGESAQGERTVGLS